MAALVPPPTDKPANRGLWYLVIGLGIAILIVVAAMIAMGIRNALSKKPEAASAAITTVPGEVPQLALDLPAGSTVAESHMEGTTLLVRISSTGGDEIFVIDPHAAKVIARVKLNKPASGATTP
jgi:hypothetical protein